jgi:hypothetical protein
VPEDQVAVNLVDASVEHVRFDGAPDIVKDDGTVNLIV